MWPRSVATERRCYRQRRTFCFLLVDRNGLNHQNQASTNLKTMKTASYSAILVVAAALLSSKADASKEFVALLPNGDNVPGASAIGHSDNTGRSSATNAFGNAFADAGKSWTLSLCQADTDGDGQTNGQELGDPCCEWSVGSTPRWTSGVSHPSDASKTSNESLWANINCTGVTTVSSSDASGLQPVGFLLIAAAIVLSLV
ncbi:hypothetical protein PF005_g29663 [Phytophthora fragariae]|nr:hypothetical protein PF009_g30028 [Phytophthora fragariae]KAE9062994.1 hypothetical protein PF010_g29172 [Phytophthora fragariae]KAE9063788.1 hypothetical protein PF007_g29431 [Phytophthora fragariae]KAE9165312.1 hypothetical protein PF005_g29663 [Phytophthora fragariae]KAE9170547.1 hypothetical protein PF002_g30058 [Phytophthora fragariae]